MFTGLIEEIGVIKTIATRGAGKYFTISARHIVEDIQIDHSISINGVCLTAVEVTARSFSVEAVAETLSKSTLKQLKQGDYINLERALRLQDRLGGHLVQGHVDGIGKILSIGHESYNSIWEFELPPQLSKYTIPKGSIAIDGVSLTITNKNRNTISVAIIPHTAKQTIFQHKKTGDQVNIETDFLAKYIENFMNTERSSNISLQWLRDKGF